MQATNNSIEDRQIEIRDSEARRDLVQSNSITSEAHLRDLLALAENMEADQAEIQWLEVNSKTVHEELKSIFAVREDENVGLGAGDVGE